MNNTIKRTLLAAGLLLMASHIRAQSWSEHAPRQPGAGTPMRANAATAILPLQPRPTRLSSVVYGFLPSDRYLAERNNLHYDLLTHLACIDFAADSLGNVSDPEFWPWTDVINEAHRNGVRVILTTTNFVASQMHYLLHSPAARQHLFTNLRDKILAYKLDGVNIDFERFYATDSGELLNQFVADLTTYLHSEIPGCEVCFAGPHYNWGGNWDFSGLAASCDYIFVMGYAYAGVSSTYTGPNAPLLGGTQNVTNTLTQQYGEVLQTHPEKLILGVPYYGNKWITRTGDPHARVVRFLRTQPYATNQAEAQIYGQLWDDTGKSPWYRRQINDTTWYQVWYDNAASLGIKYDLAKSYKLKGVGMWALGYDGDSNDLWDVIASHFLLTALDKAATPASVVSLQQNYPNPFNPVTTIRYFLPAASPVTLTIYDLLGREIARLVDTPQPAGTHQVSWNAASHPSGVYLYRLQAGGFTQTRKLLLLK